MPLNNLAGNNGSGKRPWKDAINRALAQRELTGKGRDLRALAETIIDKALEGDIAALRELGDRLDGKPTQVLAGDPDQPLITAGELVLRAAGKP